MRIGFSRPKNPVSDFSDLMSDAEELLRMSSGYAGEGFAQARRRFEERLNRMKTALPNAATRKYRQAVWATDRYVHSHPWHIAGAAAAAGILVGFFAARR